MAKQIRGEVRGTHQNFVCGAFLDAVARSSRWVGKLPEHRQRLFADEAACLARDIKQLPPQKGHVLGDPEATEMLKLWTPDVYKEVLLA